MLVKVCGITNAEQADYLQQIGVDYVGFIFYPKSLRFVSNALERKVKNAVAVFVNPSKEDIENAEAKIGKLHYLQLHGAESPMFCKELKRNYKVIKAIGIDGNTNIDAAVVGYLDNVDMFLFDTKSASHGGTGKKYDWSVLNTYTGTKPFLLSGGIGPDDVEAIKQIQHNHLIGVDVNSGFEISPGNKDLKKIEKFINELN